MKDLMIVVVSVNPMKLAMGTLDTKLRGTKLFAQVAHLTGTQNVYIQRGKGKEFEHNALVFLMFWAGRYGIAQTRISMVFERKQPKSDVRLPMDDLGW